MINTDEAIKVEHISKTFKLPHEKHTSLKNLIFSSLKKRNKGYKKSKVLNDISFEINKGEFFGIVGRNGSGKSTLLKLLAGIYSPDEGNITVNGKLTPFIELGVGFSPDLSGRENVYLNGALLGFSRTEINSKYREIVEFAELENFMDLKLKNYSSGMQVRLAFSIAIQAQSPILLLDEVLAVGDEAFQRKCYNYFSKLKKDKRTVILVSHNMSVIRDYCTKALILKNGQIDFIGDIKKVVDKYTDINLLDIKQSNKNSSIKRYGDGTVDIVKVEILNENKTSKVFKPNEEITFKINAKANKKLTSPVIGMIVEDSQGRIVFATNTLESESNTGIINNNQIFECYFRVKNYFNNGEYSISCAITNSDRSNIYARIENVANFSIGGWSMEHSSFHPPHTFKISLK